MPPADLLQPWVPSAAEPWDVRRAAHLYRRATFGHSLPELDQALTAGMPATVDTLLRGSGQPNRLDELLELVRTELVRFDENLEIAQAFWLYRMIASDRPAEEKLTLFWHGHFATANYKVKSPTLMTRQMDTLRRLAFGRFDDLLLALARDPAMLLWLDNRYNRKAAPNENFARELLELFTLGPGAYTEADVQAAARAFTGWHLDGDQFLFRPEEHDDGPKTFLGQTGNWNGEDILRQLAAHPATARHLATRLLRFYLMDPPAEDAVAALAQVYLEQDHRLDAMLDRLFRSRLFYHPDAYRALVRSPVELVVGTIRLLDANTNRDLALPALARLGQELFNPPDVRGWEGGETWLNAVTLLERANFLNDLLMRAPVRVAGRDHLLLQRLKDKKLREPLDVIDHLTEAIVQGDVDPEQRRLLVFYYANELAKLANPDNQEAWDFKLRRVAYMIMTLPAYQLS
jgi:hypothetical protein